MNPRFVRTLIVTLGCVAVVGFVGCGGGVARKGKSDERDPIHAVRMAQSLTKGGRASDALALLEEAIAKHPDKAFLRLSYGQICFTSGRYPEAEAALLEALRLDPHFTDARNYLGAVYQELGRPADAEREYRAALADVSYPSPEMIHLNLGLLHAEQGRLDEAEAALRRAVEINPRYYQAHYELASLLDRRGEFDQAAREYEVAAPAYRNQGEFHYRLGMAYFRLGERLRARENLNRVMDVAPGSPSAAKAYDLLKLLE